MPPASIPDLWVSQANFTLSKYSKFASPLSQRVDPRPYERSTGLSEMEAVVFASIYLFKEIAFTMSHLYWIAHKRHDQIGEDR